MECTSTAAPVTLHCTHRVPGLGLVFSQEDAVMPQLIISEPDLEAGNLVIRGCSRCELIAQADFHQSFNCVVDKA